MHFWDFKLFNNLLQAEKDKCQDWSFIIKDTLPDTSGQEDTLQKPTYTYITWIQGFYFLSFKWSELSTLLEEELK